MTWAEGYVAGLDYLHEYSAGLNPVMASLATLLAGYKFPEEPAECCELGFGLGTCISTHAATQSARWWGTDFNPAQAGLANELTKASGGEAALFDQSFAEFCARGDLPDFDFIGLHGIWSWISDENRRVIADFVRRKLKPGGMLYISYNTWPGYAGFLPMRELLWAHTMSQSSPSAGIPERIDGALGFAEKLRAAMPIYFKSNPQIEKRLDFIKKLPRQYLAHEYFNRDWQPMSFFQMTQWLEPAKLDFACSAHCLEHIETVNLTADHRALLAEIPDRTFRELVRDMLINQQFRRDYWIKGARPISALEQMDALRRKRVVLVTRREDVVLKIDTPIGEASLQEAIYGPILDCLSDNMPKPILEIEASVKRAGISPKQLKEAITLLIGAGYLQAAQEERCIAAAKDRTRKLNAYLADKARFGGDSSFLASPVTGGGISVSRFNQLFLRSLLNGKTTAEAWASETWELLAAQGERMLKDGAPLLDPEENLMEITRQAKEFEEKCLPVFKALQLVG